MPLGSDWPVDFAERMKALMSPTDKPRDLEVLAKLFFESITHKQLEVINKVLTGEQFLVFVEMCRHFTFADSN